MTQNGTAETLARVGDAPADDNLVQECTKLDTLLALVREEMQEIGKLARAVERMAQLAAERDGCPVELTRRERDVAKLLVEGYRDKEIAAQLGIGVSTVRTLEARGCKRLGVRGRAALAARYRAG